MGERIRIVFQRFLRALGTALSPKRILGAFGTLSRRERTIVIACLILGLAGLGAFGTKLFLTRTVSVPTQGGVWSEGFIDPPHYINPVLPDSSGTDQALEQMIFSGLLKPDNRGGFVPDLAQSVDEQDNGLSYVVTLKDGLVWQDNEPLTSADVLFTLDLLKNNDLQNPQAYFWNSVQVSALSERSVLFTLQDPDSFFPAYLTFKIIPAHIWKNIPVSQFAISEFNLKPIGSGPYQFRKIGFAKDNSISQYTLVRFKRYASPGPYFETVNLKFYSNMDDALLALKKKDIVSLAEPSIDALAAEQSERALRVIAPQGANMTLVAFNLNADPLKDKSMRYAIQDSIDAAAIVQAAYGGYATTTFPHTDIVQRQDIDQAKTLLANLGWQDPDQNGFVDRKTTPKAKKPTDLQLSLIVLNTPVMSQIANLLQNQMKQAGIELTPQALDINEYTNRLHNRSFQLALVSFAPIVKTVPDLYPLIASSQKDYPGLNISGYANPKADSLVLQVRETDDPGLQTNAYAQLADIVSKDAPFAFIAQPDIPWMVTRSVHLPAITFLETAGERFANINLWYWYTKRIWKH